MMNALKHQNCSSFVQVINPSAAQLMVLAWLGMVLTPIAKHRSSVNRTSRITSRRIVSSIIPMRLHSSFMMNSRCSSYRLLVLVVRYRRRDSPSSPGSSIPLVRHPMLRRPGILLQTTDMTTQRVLIAHGPYLRLRTTLRHTPTMLIHRTWTRVGRLMCMLRSREQSVPLAKAETPTAVSKASLPSQNLFLTWSHRLHNAASSIHCRFLNHSICCSLFFVWSPCFRAFLEILSYK